MTCAEITNYFICDLVCEVRECKGCQFDKFETVIEGNSSCY